MKWLALSSIVFAVAAMVIAYQPLVRELAVKDERLITCQVVTQSAKWREYMETVQAEANQREWERTND